MSNIVRSSELAPAVRTLLGYLDDLRRTKSDDASTKLRLVVNYCQKDEVVRNLAELLRARMPTELLSELLAADTLRVPHDPRDHLGLAYTLLYHLKQGWKYELRELLTRPMFAGGAGMRSLHASSQARARSIGLPPASSRAATCCARTPRNSMNPPASQVPSALWRR